MTKIKLGLFKSIIFSVIFCCFSFSLHAQNARVTLNKLASPAFEGRGYYNNGDGKAANFIGDEFKRIGLLPVNKSYFQPFYFPVNTFPGKMKVALDEKLLIAGQDYIVSPSCPSVKGTFTVKKVLTPLQQFSKSDFILIDKSGADSVTAATLDSISKNPPDVRGVIIVEPQKLTWSVSGKVNDKIFIRILKSALPDAFEEIKLHIQNKFIQAHKAANVMAYIPGTLYPDSFIVFTAHYDHLGRMGKQALFPGANDNASGIAMILDIAQHYVIPSNRLNVSVLFIAFAGEEAGLIGSRFYTENPPLPLEKIRFLLNLDLMGNGQEGVMVVNGQIHEKEFYMMEQINNQQQLVKEVGKRGKAANSDHYWFSEKGVPAFFLYTQGGSKAYHDIYDVPETLELTEFEDVKKLLYGFVNALLNQRSE